MKLSATLLVVLFLPIFAQAKPFDLLGYQDAGGAITLHYNGDWVDPYFATKALLLAHDSGLDITKPAGQWIAWLLERQQNKGLFQRYCKKNDAWEACADTDADDIMQALWIELLYVAAPDEGLPEAWRQSAHKAQSQLASLYDSEKGVYQVSAYQPAHLLMDNVEIYASLKNLAREQKRLGDKQEAALTDNQALVLAQAIEKIFRQEGKEEPFSISTQPRLEHKFYPDIAAQTFAWAHDMPMKDKHASESTYREWMKKHRDDWLYDRHDDYPWGLIAMAALMRDDLETVRCWQSVAHPLRYGKRWNVLEEAVFQHIAFVLKDKSTTSIPETCRVQK